MKSNSKVSRKQMLALLGSFFVLPAIAKPKKAVADSPKDLEYEILLKPDGTTVKVPKNVINKSRVLNEKVSNKSLFHWLNQNKEESR